MKRNICVEGVFISRYQTLHFSRFELFFLVYMCCLIFYVKDEDPKNSWLYLHENDIVAILNQLQIAEVFKHVLLVTSNPDGNI